MSTGSASLSRPAEDDGLGHEMDAMLAKLDLTPRLRRILSDLDVIMLAEGFLHLGTDALCQRLRCSKATLYRLADGRESMFELIINLWLARARDIGWQQYALASGWQDRLVRFLGAAKIATHDASLQFMRDVWAFPGGFTAVKAHQEQRVSDIEWIIDEGVADGAFHDVHAKLAAELLFHSMRMAVEPEFLTRVGLPLHDAFSEAYRIFEYGLLRAPTTDGAQAPGAVASRPPIAVGPRSSSRPHRRRGSTGTTVPRTDPSTASTPYIPG